MVVIGHPPREPPAKPFFDRPANVPWIVKDQEIAAIKLEIEIRIKAD
jgi:hypothetical protein